MDLSIPLFDIPDENFSPRSEPPARRPSGARNRPLRKTRARFFSFFHAARGVSPLTAPEPENTTETVEANGPFHHLALQSTAVFLVASLLWPDCAFRNENPPWPETAFAIGGAAFLIASLARQPWWWRLIHALFVPMLWKIHTYSVAPGWFLLLFALLFIFYRGAPAGRVPLYFSNRATSAAVARIVEDHGKTRKTPSPRFIDLGAGIGSLVRPLARALPDARISGIENAPAVWLIGFIAARWIWRLPNCGWLWGDFWKFNLSDHDIVYAFLSPAPMAALMAKLRAEMRPGSLFISNSFAVPDILPDEIIEAGDARLTRLYLYRL
jgi:hypothetical protein